MRRTAAARVLAGVALLACAGALRATEPAPAPLPAQALFDSAYSTPAGEAASLAALRGRPLLVNFWARWCTPCRAEIPELRRAQALHPSVTVIGIDLDESPEAVREFATAYDIDYRLLVTRGDGIELLRALGNPAASLPFTLAIDARGGIVGSRLGVLRPGDLDALLQALR